MENPHQASGTENKWKHPVHSEECACYLSGSLSWCPRNDWVNRSWGPENAAGFGGWEKEKLPRSRKTTNKGRGLVRPQKAELEERMKRNSVQLQGGVNGGREDGRERHWGLGPEGPLVLSCLPCLSMGSHCLSQRTPCVPQLPWHLPNLLSRLLSPSTVWSSCCFNLYVSPLLLYFLSSLEGRLSLSILFPYCMQ